MMRTGAAGGGGRGVGGSGGATNTTIGRTTTTRSSDSSRQGPASSSPPPSSSSQFGRKETPTKSIESGGRSPSASKRTTTLTTSISAEGTGGGNDDGGHNKALGSAMATEVTPSPSSSSPLQHHHHHHHHDPHKWSLKKKKDQEAKIRNNRRFGGNKQNLQQQQQQQQDQETGDLPRPPPAGSSSSSFSFSPSAEMDVIPPQEVSISTTDDDDEDHDDVDVFNDTDDEYVDDVGDDYSDIEYDPCEDPHRAWTEQSVRQQLWDALRLARCVLFDKKNYDNNGQDDSNNPQQQQRQRQQQRLLEKRKEEEDRPEWKYQRVSNHTILHAIKRVAEMKLELIALHQQLREVHEEGSNDKKEESPIPPAAAAAAAATLAAAAASTTTREAHDDEDDDVNDLVAIRDDADSSIRRLLFAAEEEDKVEAAPVSPSTNFEMILQGLYDRVDETSKQTTAKIEALHIELAEAQLQQNQKQQGQQREQGDDLIPEEEEVTNDKDLNNEASTLDAYYKTALSNKDVEIAIWKDRCEELEALAIRPTSKTQRLLKKIVSSTRQTPFTHEDDGDGDEDIRHEASLVLSQIEDWNQHQQNTVDGLSVHLDAIKERTAKRTEEVEFFELQREMLSSDNESLRSSQRQDLASTRARQEYEIANLLKEESRLVQQMEALEVELTHLAFSNVDIEDTSKDVEVKKDEWINEIVKMKEESQRSSARLRTFHQKVKRSLEMQSVRLGLDVLTEEDDEAEGEDGDVVNDGVVRPNAKGKGACSTKKTPDAENNSPSFDSDTDSTRSATTVTSLASGKKVASRV